MAPPPSPPRFPKPRIFLTRTQGRLDGPASANTITLGQIVDKRAICTDGEGGISFSYSFFIGQEEYFDYLPLRTNEEFPVSQDNDGTSYYYSDPVPPHSSTSVVISLKMESPVKSLNHSEYLPTMVSTTVSPQPITLVSPKHLKSITRIDTERTFAASMRRSNRDLRIPSLERSFTLDS